MKPKARSAPAPPQAQHPSLALVCLGALLGLTLLKFGNPPIMEKWVSPPSDLFELVLGSPWPISWAYLLLGLVTLIALATTRTRFHAPVWLLGLPVAWLIWQCLAALTTINPALTRPVLVHFAACVVCFYLAFSCSPGARSAAWVLPGLLCAFLIVIIIGWQQHFGGLEQTRRYFFLYLYPKLNEVPPEYLKKLSSTRIFSTLFYPNALAGAVLLLMPPVLQFVWQWRERFTAGARAFLVGAIALGGLGCLYWSGSKGGWLLMLLLSLLWLLRLPFSISLKRAVVALLVVGGLLGFFWRYSGFFQKGATSVGARFDYWRAASKNTLDHPVTGTGPGTFSIAYQRLKRPESEMARLAHNDYLQQASDSGLPGFAFYLTFIVGSLAVGFPAAQPEVNSTVPATRDKPGGVKPQSEPGVPKDADSVDLWFALWLGTFGWALQSLMEFGLYIPALAWPAFAFLGLLLRFRFQSDSRKTSTSPVVPVSLPPA